jgi:hypothetical protein
MTTASIGLASAPREYEGEPEIDLDRVVWDPEYRQEVRELLKDRENAHHLNAA